MGVGNGHKPPPKFAPAQCFSPRIATDHRCRPLLLNTAKRRAMPISAQPSNRAPPFCDSISPCSKACELFDFFDFSILNLVASYLSTTAHYFGHPNTCRRSPWPIQSSEACCEMVSLCCCCYIAAAQNSTYGEGCLAMECTWNAGNERSDWSDIYVALAVSIPRCLLHQV